MIPPFQSPTATHGSQWGSELFARCWQSTCKTALEAVRMSRVGHGLAVWALPLGSSVANAVCVRMGARAGVETTMRILIYLYIYACLFTYINIGFLCAYLVLLACLSSL